MKLNIRNITYILLLCLLQTTLAYGQLEPPLPPGPPGLVPIDGGVIALVVAGIFYGIKKNINKK
jgi:hypothetical protein